VVVKKVKMGSPLLESYARQLNRGETVVVKQGAVTYMIDRCAPIVDLDPEASTKQIIVKATAQHKEGGKIKTTEFETYINSDD
jgi:hypothetical protein